MQTIKRLEYIELKSILEKLLEGSLEENHETEKVAQDCATQMSLLSANSRLLKRTLQSKDFQDLEESKLHKMQSIKAATIFMGVKETTSTDWYRGRENKKTTSSFVVITTDGNLLRLQFVERVKSHREELLIEWSVFVQSGYNSPQSELSEFDLTKSSHEFLRVLGFDNIADSYSYTMVFHLFGLNEEILETELSNDEQSIS